MDVQLLFERMRTILLVAHIASGTVCLLVGTYVAMRRKGTSLHRQLGSVYFGGMIIVCGTALLLATARLNLPLLLIAVFSGYMASSGYRSPKIERKGRATVIDKLLVASMLCGGFGMLAWGLVHGSAVLLVFGGIGLTLAVVDVRLFYRLRTILPGQHRLRDALKRRHRGMMSGSLISVWTAFLVTTVPFEPAWILWLTPSVIGFVGLIFSRSSSNLAAMPGK